MEESSLSKSALLHALQYPKILFLPPLSSISQYHLSRCIIIHWVFGSIEYMNGTNHTHYKRQNSPTSTREKTQIREHSSHPSPCTYPNKMGFTTEVRPLKKLLNEQSLHLKVLEVYRTDLWQYKVAPTVNLPSIVGRQLEQNLILTIRINLFLGHVFACHS